MPRNLSIREAIASPAPTGVRVPNRRAAMFAGFALLALAALPAVSARAADFRWRGTLDVVLAEQSNAFANNTLTRGDNPYDPYRLRMFGESMVNDRLQVMSQFVYDDASGLYVDGAYAIYTPSPAHDLHVLAGKLPWAIGTWAPRTYSNRNPLIGAPLMYQHHTTLLWYDVPPSADQLLATAGNGAKGVNYFGYPEGTGMPIVDDSYWDVGITVTGSLRPIEYAIGGVAGTPSWGSTSRDDNSGKSYLGRIGFAPRPDLRLGVSGSYGPYLADKLNPEMPAGTDVNDYHQKLLMADLEVMVGHVELRAEGARNFFETPTLGELSVHSAYAELKYLLDSGVYLAGRWDTQRFGRVMNSAGEWHPWDWNVVRGEAGIGYRVTRDATLKLSYQHSQFETGVPGFNWRNESILAGQASIGF